MKRTNKTGCTCVGDLRLSPLDIGFDLRVVGTPIALPAQFGSVGLDIDGETYLIEGTRDEMIAAICEAGYTITLDAAIQNVMTDREEAAWWQHGTYCGVKVGRWVEFGGTPCYNDHQVWCIEQDAADILNHADGGDRFWDDGRHTDEIRDMAQTLRDAWNNVPIPTDT